MNHLLVYVIVILLIVCLIICASANKYKKTIKRNEKKAKDIASRRKISKSDRQYVLERDNYTCQICGISKQYLDSFQKGLGDYLLFEVDHIQSVAKGGTGADVNNLQCLCWRCNRKKGGSKTNKDVSNTITYGMKYMKKKG
ncbi:MAG: HNH endonuclease signature motif containing protein [Bacilli bacterium]|nr:HNH endonuclease signature motif containing protein [Bacilli bacterium]